MATGEEMTKVVLFDLDHETYGVPVEQVLSIEPFQTVTRVPHAADFVSGVMNLRGAIIPVIDIRRRLNMGHAAVTKESRVIVVEEGDVQAGLLVDMAREVADIPAGGIEKTPDIVGGPEARFISGVAKISQDRLLVLLNLEQVLNDREIEDLKNIER
ncbi:chemotaxis protein CheW [Sporolactobacillus sp. Y61]|jgi:purine-binding chemotaxis protein CheW|uniref:Chemotaxis protein CheW n=1 Tax=Sporolactobacillus sp. Y61 TaxID=3160863 RepID=A0AAU8ICY0_9BACL|nr:chemotaxis protein CheW [Sporolactobacillus sp. THM19-2]RYL92970.1 chemotaxis protein CheW [Sporolactobacillus sp. THM19-2]